MGIRMITETSRIIEICIQNYHYKILLGHHIIYHFGCLIKLLLNM
jgi:hypothetical protein